MIKINGLDNESRREIILRRDDQYDDVFFFAVTTTGIYCRPSCPARRPLQENCLFFETAASAERQGFRACLRCRPSQPKVNLADSIVSHIDAQEAGGEENVKELATSARISERHLRRLVKTKTGVTPFQIGQTKRLNKAKELLRRTELPIIEVAFTAGFSSVRQFNSAFKNAYSVTPSMLRQSELKEATS